MKSVINSQHLHSQQPHTQQHQPSSQHTLPYLQQQNKQCQTTIQSLTTQLNKLQQDNTLFDKQIAQKKQYLDLLKKQILVQACQCQGECQCAQEQIQVKQHHDADGKQEGQGIEQEEEKNQGQQEFDMEDWIHKVQNYSGLAPQAIDLLVEMEYQANTDEQQICLSCYQPMQIGTLSKYLPCSHIFHSLCINNHLKTNKLCPACGEEVIPM